MHRARVFALVPLFAASLCQAQYPGSTPVPAEVKKGFDAITVDSAKRHLTYLAGPECQGRGTGQPGFQKAAEYMAARFKENGLKPIGVGGTYFQNVPFVSTSFDASESEITIGSQRMPANGFLVNTRESADITGKLVVIDAAGERLDLSGQDLEGAVLVVRGDVPARALRTAALRAKVALVLQQTDKLPTFPPAVSRGRGGRAFGGPTGYVLKDVVEAMTAALKMGELAFEGGENRPTKSEISTDTVHVVAKVETKEVMVPNVVGLLEGTDPLLKAEVVGVGAHLDHLGVQGGTVFPGADDDGSGSTALIEVLTAFHANSALKPKRSILFMAFCGEEMGLVGSGYYSDNPIIPHDKMIAELQMDMVGRDSDGVQNGDQNRVDKASENIDTIRLVGSKRISTELDSLIQDQNKHLNFRFKYDAEDVYTRSDHYNFAKHGIPIAFLFDGFHPDYHQPTDTVDKIDFPKLTNAAKLYFLTAMKLANNPLPPKKDATGG